MSIRLALDYIATKLESWKSAASKGAKGFDPSKHPRRPDAKICGQCYLCDNLGQRLIDPTSGQCRRIDLLVVQGGKTVKSIEVTSRKAAKSTQMNKEKRIRADHRKTGKDLYAQIKGGDVVKIPYSLKTRVWRTEDFAA